jgi:hypothetical protein
VKKVNVTVRFTVSVPDATDIASIWTQPSYVEFLNGQDDLVAEFTSDDADYETVSVEPTPADQDDGRETVAPSDENYYYTPGSSQT